MDNQQPVIEFNSTSTKKLIIQFGRLDRSYRNKIKFSFEEESEAEADLTSSYLIKTNAFKDAVKLIIFPKSIIFQNSLLELKDDPFIEKLKTVDIDEYQKEPEALLRYHPHAEGSELLVVSSFGSYSFGKETYTFNGSLDIITLQIYLHLAVRFSTDGLEEVFIDISSGQNIYIAALLNGMYSLLPFIKYKRFFHSKNERALAFILNSDPIIGKPLNTIKIQKSIFSSNTINAFPYKNSEKMQSLIKKIFTDEDYCKKLEKLLKEDYFLLHGALIYGSPLMLTLADEQLLNSLFYEVGLEQILNRIQDFYSGQNNDFKLLKFSSSDIFACTFALALAQSIYVYFIEIISKKEIVYSVEKKGNKDFSLKNEMVDNAFELMHSVYGQPEPNYKGEIKKLAGQAINSDSNLKFISFYELNKISNPNYKANKELDPRNYFAHSGLELNITEIKKEADKIFLHYNEDLATEKRTSIINYMKK